MSMSFKHLYKIIKCCFYLFYVGMYGKICFCYQPFHIIDGSTDVLMFTIKFIAHCDTVYFLICDLIVETLSLSIKILMKKFIKKMAGQILLKEMSYRLFWY